MLPKKASLGDGRLEGQRWVPLPERPRATQPYVRKTRAVPQRPPGTRIAHLLSEHLAAVYTKLNPDFKYNSNARPKSYLTQPSKGVGNDGKDNANRDLIVYFGQEITDANSGDSYIVRGMLGKGTFGQVVKARNLRTNEQVAIKIIRNHKAYYKQSQTEILMLRRLYDRFGHNGDGVHVVKLLQWFDFEKHLCLVFELLGVNLWELVDGNKYRGLRLETVRKIVTQVLTTLKGCAEVGIVHCDLKPENILLVRSDKANIKLIDFGSACDERNSIFEYIQSRYYRAPEVMLGCKYDAKIDMWSLGCVAAELFLGLPLFPGYNDYNLLCRIVMTLGSPPRHLLDHGKHTMKYFNKISQDSPTPPEPHSEANGGGITFLPAYGYRLKSEDEYYATSEDKREPFKQYFNYKNLGDIVLNYLIPKHVEDMVGEAKEAALAEVKRERIIFTDFLHGLLNPDPMERWPAELALQHPFICGKEFNGPGHFHHLYMERCRQERARSIPFSLPPSGGTGTSFTGMFGTSPAYRMHSEDVRFIDPSCTPQESNMYFTGMHIGYPSPGGPMEGTSIPGVSAMRAGSLPAVYSGTPTAPSSIGTNHPPPPHPAHLSQMGANTMPVAVPMANSFTSGGGQSFGTRYFPMVGGSIPVGPAGGGYMGGIPIPGTSLGSTPTAYVPGGESVSSQNSHMQSWTDGSPPVTAGHTTSPSWAFPIRVSDLGTSPSQPMQIVPSRHVPNGPKAQQNTRQQPQADIPDDPIPWDPNFSETDPT